MGHSSAIVKVSFFIKGCREPLLEIYCECGIRGLYIFMGDAIGSAQVIGNRNCSLTNLISNFKLSFIILKQNV